MSIENATIVDVMGVELDTGCAVLTIADNLDWSDVARHLAVLERKVNAYLAFSRHHSFYEAYPEAKGRKLKIAVFQQFQPTPEAYAALSAYAKQIEAVGVAFWFGEQGGDTRVQRRPH